MQMIPTRIFFEKTGRAKYTSHLDTMRTMTRAFKRSRLPLWYTEGFNPHLYCTFALPIALGYESLCETVDVRLTEPVGFDEVARRLSASLPPGLRAVRAAAPVMDAVEIAWADYSVTLRYDKDAARLVPKLDELLAQPAIEVVKRTKKGERSVDIRPHVNLLDREAAANGLRLTLRTAAGNTLNINPTLLLREFYSFSGAEPAGMRIVRTSITNKNGEVFL